MCVIIEVPAGIKVPMSVLQDCYTANPDGWGIMFHFTGELFAFKNTTGFQDFLKYWENTPEEVTRFIHFRIRTAGEVNAEMCHPFSFSIKDAHDVQHEFLLMHNGMLDTLELDPKKSDTWHFARCLEGVFDGSPDFLHDSTNNMMIADASIGSKLVFLDSTGHVFKFGEWNAKHGCSFSNLYFEHVGYRTWGGMHKDIGIPYSSRVWENWGWDPEESCHDAMSHDPLKGTACGTISGLDEYQEERSKYSKHSHTELMQELDYYLESQDYTEALKFMQENCITAQEVSNLFDYEYIVPLLQHVLESYTFE